MKHRDRGVDAARGLALIGMVLVHLQTDFFGITTVQMVSPYWDLVLSVFSNRARPMFFLLAGFAAATVIKSRTQHFMFRRSAYVTAVGVLLALIGWSDLVLVFYGILFLFAPLIARLNAQSKLTFAVGLLGVGISAQVYEVYGIAVISELVSYFILGMWISTQKRKTIKGVGLLLLVTYLPFSLSVGVGIYTPTESLPDSIEWWELVLFCTSNVGILFVTIEFCRWATDRGRLTILVAIGTIPLSAFFAHAVYFVCIQTLSPKSSIVVFASTLAFLATLSVVASKLYRLKRQAPLEALLRRFTTQKL